MPQIKIQQSVFDLAEMREIMLTKRGPFEPVNSVPEAMQRCHGSNDKLLQVLNLGFEALAAEELRQSEKYPWLVVDEEGNASVYEGRPADPKLMNAMVLNYAKALYGWKKAASKEEKREAKARAMEKIRGDAELRDGLMRNSENNALLKALGMVAKKKQFS